MLPYRALCPGNRLRFQETASAITSTDYAKLDAIELPHLDPFGRGNVDRKWIAPLPPLPRPLQFRPLDHDHPLPRQSATSLCTSCPRPARPTTARETATRPSPVP